MRNQPTYLHEIYDFGPTSYEVGLQRGKQFAEHLKNKLKSYSFGNPGDRTKWPPPENYNLDYFKENHPNQYNDWKKALDKTPEWFREEARGIAEGAGVPYERVIIMEDLFPFRMGKINTSKARVPAPSDDCNGFVAFGKGTVGGRVLVGGNGETDHASIKHMAIFRIKSDNYNNYVYQTKRPWGMTCQCGINDKGVALFGSGVGVIEEEYGMFGFRHLVRRRALHEANNIDEAIDILKEGPRMGGQHIYLGDPKRAVHIEYSGKRIEVIDPEKGFEAGASSAFSHPNMKKCLPYITDMDDPRFWDLRSGIRSGIFRMERHHELFEKYKPLTLEMIPRHLGDHGGRGTGLIRESIEGACPQGSDFTICIHGSMQATSAGGSHGTMGSFRACSFSNIEIPDLRKMYIAFGNACEAGYVPLYPPK